MDHPINFKGFIQICIVVEDIQKAVEQWSLLLGIEPPQIKTDPAVPNPDLTYRGAPACYGIQMACIPANGFVIELIQPDHNPSTFREFLDEHGNGVHHIGFEVGEVRDAMVTDLEALGYAMRTIGYYPGSSWTVVDSEKQLGVNLNIKPKA